eukprot:scaffold293544_cov41-Prasinocladus_malaysianus.AAC.1
MERGPRPSSAAGRAGARALRRRVSLSVQTCSWTRARQGHGLRRRKSLGPRGAAADPLGPEWCRPKQSRSLGKGLWMPSQQASG